MVGTGVDPVTFRFVEEHALAESALNATGTLLASTAAAALGLLLAARFRSDGPLSELCGSSGSLDR